MTLRWSDDASRKRQASERLGAWSETAAAAALVAKGYRILGRRLKTRVGEIDIVAVRGRRLAFVEVKRRPTRAAAEASLTDHQGHRIREAADLWLARHPRYRDHDIHFDAIFVLPLSWPRHMPDAV